MSNLGIKLHPCNFMQDESFYKSVLLVPSTAEWRRDELKAKLKDSGENIQKWEHNIASYGRQIKQVQSALDPTKKKSE